MLIYKKACKDTLVANLMMIFKFICFLAITTPTQAHWNQGVEAISMSLKLPLQSIAISLSKFFHFESILLEVTFVYSFTYLSSLYIP